MTDDTRPKVTAILAAAEEILRDHGDHGLSMRKLATRSGMSLGHLQHYFPTKNDVLIALIQSYFDSCKQALQAHAVQQADTDSKERVANLVTFGLSYVGGDLSDMCRLFREFWALATRNDEVSRCLDAYYKAYSDSLFELLEPVAASPEAARQAVTFLIPWFEGYSITHFGMDIDASQTAHFLTETVITIVQGHGD